MLLVPPLPNFASSSSTWSMYALQALLSSAVGWLAFALPTNAANVEFRSRMEWRKAAARPMDEADAAPPPVGPS